MEQVGHDALAGLVRARGTALVRYAYLLTGDPHTAEELVQETVVRVLAHRTGSRAEPEALEAYIRTAMLNLVIDRGRRRQRWLRMLPRLASHNAAAASAEDEVVPASEARAALQLLSPRQRACVVLRYWDDEPVHAIAARLGLSEGTVKRHLADAAARLRAALAPTTEGGDDARRPPAQPPGSPRAR